MIAKQFYFVCLACAFTFPWSPPVEAAPQDEKTMEKYGPKPDLFESAAITSAIDTWRWQMEYSNQQQKLIQQLENEWTERAAEYQKQLSAFREKMVKIGIPYPQDARALESIDTAIRNAEANRLALDAEMRRLSLRLKMAATANDEISRQLRAELKTLQQRVEEMKQAEKRDAFENANEREMRPLKMEIERIEKALKQFMTESPTEDGAMFESVTAAYHKQESKLYALREIQAAIGKLQPLENTQRLKNKIARAEKMAETAQTRRFELKLENTRYQALIDLAPYPATEAKEK